MKLVRKQIIGLIVVLISIVVGIRGVMAAEPQYIFNLSGGKGGLEKIWVDLNEDRTVDVFIKNNRDTAVEGIRVPYKEGYGFEGYYFGSYEKNVISRRGKIKNLNFSELIMDRLGSQGGTYNLEAKFKPLEYKVNLRSDITLTNPGTTTLLFTGMDEGVAYTSESRQTDYVEVPEAKGYKFKGYYLNGEKVIDEKGKILASPYTKEISEKYEEYNENGYKVKNVLKGFRENNVKEMTLKAKWEEGSKETVKLTSIKINLEGGVVKKGGELKLPITVEPEGATEEIEYTSSDENVASIDVNGKITGIRAGRTTITARGKESEEISDSTIITVTKDGLPISADDIMTVEVGQTKKITYEKEEAEETEAYKYNADNPLIATVDAEGNVTGVAEGSATVTITTESGEKVGIIQIEVDKLTEAGVREENRVATVDGVTQKTDKENNKSVRIECLMGDNWVKPSKTKKFKYKVYNNTKKEKVKLALNKKTSKNVLKWNSKTKKMTGIKKGTTSIKVTVGKTSKTCKILVRKKLSKADKKQIEADKSKAVIEAEIEGILGTNPSNPTTPTNNEKLIIKNCPITLSLKDKINLNAANGTKPYTWKSSDTKIAKVNKKNGKVTPKKTGTVKIIVTDKKQVKSICKFKVTKNYTSTSMVETQSNVSNSKTNLKIQNCPNNLNVGDSITLKATGGNKSYIWKNKTPEIIDNNKGKITANKTGKATIQVTDGTSVATCNINIKKTKKYKNDPFVSNNNKKLIIKNCPKNKIELGKTINLDATGGKSPYKWKSGNTKIATVNGKGKVTGKKVGTTIIKATDKHGNKVTCKITFKKKEKKSSTASNSNSSMGSSSTSNSSKNNSSKKSNGKKSKVLSVSVGSTNLNIGGTSYVMVNNASSTCKFKRSNKNITVEGSGTGRTIRGVESGNSNLRITCGHAIKTIKFKVNKKSDTSSSAINVNLKNGVKKNITINKNSGIKCSFKENGNIKVEGIDNSKKNKVIYTIYPQAPTAKEVNGSTSVVCENKKVKVNYRISDALVIYHKQGEDLSNKRVAIKTGNDNGIKLFISNVNGYKSCKWFISDKKYVSLSLNIGHIEKKKDIKGTSSVYAIGNRKTKEKKNVKVSVICGQRTAAVWLDVK